MDKNDLLDADPNIKLIPKTSSRKQRVCTRKYKTKYATEEERIQAQNTQKNEWKKRNQTKMSEYAKTKYYPTHKENVKQSNQKYMLNKNAAQKDDNENAQ